jgi:hypothetical protein
MVIDTSVIAPVAHTATAAALAKDGAAPQETGLLRQSEPLVTMARRGAAKQPMPMASHMSSMFPLRHIRHATRAPLIDAANPKHLMHASAHMDGLRPFSMYTLYIICRYCIEM